jgi:hypothetical protein
LVTLTASYGFKDGLNLNTVKALSVLSLSAAATVPWHVNDFCTVYGGVGGRVEDLTLVSDYLPDNGVAFGNDTAFGQVGAKLRLWRLGADLSYSRDLAGTYLQDGALKLAGFFGINF